MSISGFLTTSIGLYTDDYTTSDGAEAVFATLIGVYVVTFAIAMLFAVASYVVLAIGLAGVFRKAGIEPWKAWVPIYSTFVWLQLGGQNGHWIWATFVPGGSIVTSVFLYIGMHRTGKAFGKETGFLVLGIFLPWIWVLILGLGKDEYHPERITAAGLGGPLVGYGAGSQPGYAPVGYAPAGYQGGGYPSNGYQQAGQAPSAYSAAGQPPAYQPAAGQQPSFAPPAVPAPSSGPVAPAPAAGPAPSSGPIAPTPAAGPVPTAGPVAPAPTAGPTPSSDTPPSLSKE